MLPDFPQTKELLSKAFIARIEVAEKRELGVFDEIPTTEMFEGARTHLHRADGSSEQAEPMEFTVGENVDFDVINLEMIDVTPILAKLESIGRGMAGEKIKQLLKVTEKAAHEVGNVGSYSSAEGILAMLEKWQIDFDDHGQMKNSQIMVGSDDAKLRIMEYFEQIASDPSLRQRHDRIMARKIQEYRDRETARELVE